MSFLDQLSFDKTPRVWQVGTLCRAVADSLEARFNPVTVHGEISGFSRAGSGHCYFSIKDASGQLRCAMFRRAAMAMNFSPRDGDLVEVRGRLAVYEQRGDLQLVVDQLQRAGQGAWFEQFLRLKAQLELQGLFDPTRKRQLPAMPRGIGVVTSLNAAALHDVSTALHRRVPHIPVLIAPAMVQGTAAAVSIVDALQRLYDLIGRHGECGVPYIDAILLVRGGGAMEDLWAFNDEHLAHMIVKSPVPLISGVGHETDFTIADFCADLRAPTPTAAAELVASPRQIWIDALNALALRIRNAAQRHLDAQNQSLDTVAQHLGRPNHYIAQQRLRLSQLQQRMRHGVQLMQQMQKQRLQVLGISVSERAVRRLHTQRDKCEQWRLRFDLLSPQRVLERGYSMLMDADGRAISSVAQAPVGTPLKAILVDGSLDVTVTQPKLL